MRRILTYIKGISPHFEFSKRERVGYFQLKASVSLSISQSQITVIIMLIV